MILSVQYMRAIAALLVVVSHVALKGEQYSSNPLGWFNVGGAGVDLFFIISGYIMCHTVDHKQVDFVGFIKARLKRIIPLYWVLTTAALIVFIVFPEKINSSGGATNIIHSYTLFPTVDKYLIQNGWTLSYEFFFYSIFASCLALTVSFRYLLPAVIILGLVSIGYYGGSNNFQIQFLTNSLLIEFVFGILIFYFFKTKSLSYFFGGGLIILSIFMLTLVNNYQFEVPRVVSYGMPALLFFIGMMALEPLFKKIETVKMLILLKNLGNSSYSLYLCHPFSLVLCSIVFKKLGLHEFGYSFVFLLLIGAIVSGHLCYVMIEKKLIKLLNPTRSYQGVNNI